MHNAPAVSYPAGRSSFTLAVIAAVWLAGGTGVALWAAQAQPSAAAIAMAAITVIATGGLALHSWFGSPEGVLSWDGQGWTWTAAASQPRMGTPELALDAQHSLLLRWKNDGAVQWLWLERKSQPARWDDLRRAVYSRARPEALAGAQARGEAKP